MKIPKTGAMDGSADEAKNINEAKPNDPTRLDAVLPAMI